MKGRVAVLVSGVFLSLALGCSGSEATKVPIPAIGTEIGDITLESGNKVAAGKVDKIEGTRVLILHEWDGTEDWVEWKKVASVAPR